jgi:hypothetical protein
MSVEPICLLDRIGAQQLADGGVVSAGSWVMMCVEGGVGTSWAYIGLPAGFVLTYLKISLDTYGSVAVKCLWSAWELRDGDGHSGILFSIANYRTQKTRDAQGWEQIQNLQTDSWH